MVCILFLSDRAMHEEMLESNCSEKDRAGSFSTEVDKNLSHPSPPGRTTTEFASRINSQFYQRTVVPLPKIN